MNYELLTQELLEYYANLLIVQYNGKSKASQTIKLLADMLIAGCLIFQIRDAFDYRTAVVQNAYNFTVVGSPTITDDGIASGFNSENYLTVPFDITKPFELKYRFKHTSSANQNTATFLSLSEWQNAIVCSPSSHTLWLTTTNPNFSRPNAEYTRNIKGVEADTWYNGYLKWDGETYTFGVEGKTPQTISSIYPPKININKLLYLGRYRSLTEGKLDLKQFKIIVDGVEVYKAWQPPAINYRTAVGAQLDIIGKWVGVSRFYNASKYWNSTFLSYPNSNDLVPTDKTDTLQHGYSDYSNFDSETGNILTYDALSSVKQSLSDDNYRIVIGLKIIKNNINHIRGEIDKAIWDYFNHRVYTTWDTHKITYNYPPELADIINICAYKKVLPVPIGCSISYYQYS